jgi:hypothetical protein
LRADLDVASESAQLCGLGAFPSGMARSVLRIKNSFDDIERVPHALPQLARFDPRYRLFTR